MSKPSDNVDEFTFVMTCMQQSEGGWPKVNFEEVAKLTGAKSASACYHRLWTIKKKFGMTGSKKGPAGPSASGAPRTPKSIGKRGRGKKDVESAAENGNGVQNGGSSEDEGSPSKKVKTEENGDSVLDSEESVDGE